METKAKEATNYETISLQNMEKYRTFDTVAQMDEAIYEYIEVLRQDEQPESVIEVLRFLGRSSLRVTGVSFAKYQTIGDNIGKSVSTIKRAVKALKSYDIIEAIPTTRKWIGRGRRKSVNIIVIKPNFAYMTGQDELSNNVEKVEQNKADKSESQSEPVNYKHDSVIYSNTYCTDNIIVRTSYQRFKDAIKQFVGNGKQSVISRLYGVYMGQTKGLRGNYDDNELMDVAIQAIQTTFTATKCKKLRNIAGYFNGVLSNLFDRMHSDLMAELFA